MTASRSNLPAAALIQLCAALIAFSLAYLAYRPMRALPLAMALLQGACAAFIAWKLESPRWWLLIHLLFMPLAVVVMAAGVDPGWYLAAFVVMLLLFWRIDRSRVPLYLSNQRTADAVLALMPPTACRVLDAGCGDGGLLRRLARARPDCHFVGIEHAPLLWLWARLLGHGLPNLQIGYGSFWQHDFAPYSLVYAFLSPAPMAALWRKAGAEMAPDSLLLSNSFPIPEQIARQTIAVDDRRKTRLYCYKPRE